MLGNLGAGELILLLVIALLVFGANRLPEAGRTVGKGLREFRRALTDAQDAMTGMPSGDPPPRRPERDDAGAGRGGQGGQGGQAGRLSD